MIKGNHDILKKEWYMQAGIAVADKHLTINRFCFVHDIKEACTPSDNISYYISGHIHPCIVLRGLGKQTISFPCYFFSEKFAVLPAFSKFTGGAIMEKKATDNVFAILNPDISKGQMPSVIKV